MKLPFIKVLNNYKFIVLTVKQPTAFTMLLRICAIAEVSTDKDNITTNKAVITPTILQVSQAEYRSNLKKLVDMAIINILDQQQGKGGGTLVEILPNNNIVQL